METILTLRPVESENFQRVNIKDLEFSMKKSSKQKTNVKSYQMDSDMAQQRISDSIYQFIESNNVHLEFEVDIDRGTILVKVTNDITGDVIREISLGTILYADKNMKSMNGMLIETTV